MPKRRHKTLDQVEKMRQKAVRFLRDVLGDDERAREYERMSPKDYAKHKHVEIAANPTRSRMAAKSRPTRTELEERIQELEDENTDLNDKLDSIVDLASGEEEEEEDEGDDEEGEA